jgi:hypothetical protein
MEFLNWILANYMAIGVAVLGLVVAVIAILKFVPGNQGEEEGGWLDKVKVFLEKIFGKKP